MTVTQTTSNHGQPGNLRCKRCKTILPIHATFCGSCGARVDRSAESPTSRVKSNVVERYRITSLIRRRPHVQLFLALDNQQKRPVVIRDITISDLDEHSRAQVIEASRREFELLRSQPIPDVTPVIDLRTFHDHFFLISGWPFKISKQYRGKVNTQPYTLHDLLQSGIGLPEEQIAISWTHRLCHALALLHQQQIIIGDLDPYAIVVSTHHYNGQPALTVSWLPFSIRDFLPKTSTAANAAHFTAPEALLGDVEPRSDIYSLGAILYLLLTGSAPEQPALNPLVSLRTPREVNPRISSAIDAVVMQALSAERTERYQSAEEMADILLDLCSTTTVVRPGYSSPSMPKFTKKLTSTPVTTDVPFASSNTRASEEEPFHDDVDDVTISIVPLQAQLVRWHMSKLEANRLDVNEQTDSSNTNHDENLAQSLGAEVAEPSSYTLDTKAVEPFTQPSTEDLETPLPVSDAQDSGTLSSEVETKKILHTTAKEDLHTQKDLTEEETIHINPLHASEAGVDDIPELPTSALADITANNTASEQQNADSPALEDENEQEEESQPEPLLRSTQLPLKAQTTEGDTLAPQGIKERIAGTLPRLLSTRLAGAPVQSSPEDSLLKRVQRFILGEQQHVTTAAALIETPLRIQPNQNYSIRIHLMGRNEPKRGAPLAGLSALIHGETVHIEVRSALYQNYAYIVQQANVQIPSSGYAAEVTMPMQALSTGPSGRRERLHIFFMDEARRPLYEKPFVIELFISSLVQAGREGHSILTIPL